MSSIDNVVSPPDDMVIVARGLRKSYGDAVAVDGLDLTVPAGSVLALLGPNGAGKTTTIKLLTTLLPIEAGRATVAGHDVATEPDAVRRRIGVAGQAAAVDQKLTARQNLDLFGRLYHLRSAWRRRRVDELVERFDMADYVDRPVETLSGGQRRRLDLAAALIADPPALFVDEPTTGLDPLGRKALWQQIREIREDGTGVVLTTQYLEEADQLADDIVIIDRGVVVARGSAPELKARLGNDVLEISLAGAEEVEPAVAVLEGQNVAVVDDHTLQLPVASPGASLAALRRVEDAGVALADYQLRRPTLDDVFIELTGGAAAGPPTDSEVAA